MSLLNYGWIVFALLYSIVHTIQPIICEKIKVRSLHLLVWQRVFAVLLFSPILFFLEPPSDLVFYIAIIAGSFIFCYTDLVFYGLVRNNGAGVVLRIEPLSSWSIFAVWVIVSPALLLDYISQPLRSLGILVSMSFCIFFALRLKKCSISWDVLKRILPITVLIAIGTVTSKIAMDHSPLHSGVFYYGFVQSLFMALIFITSLKFKHIPTLGNLDVQGNLFNKRSIIGGALFAIFGLMMAQPLKYYSISLVENPAYVTIFTLLSPIWILLLYKIIGRKEKADIISGLGIVFFTAIMIVFTQM